MTSVVLSASSGLRFPSLVCCIWLPGQVAWGLGKKLNSPAVSCYSKFWFSSPVCLLWVFSSSDRFSIFLSRSCAYIQDYCEDWMRCVYNALQCLGHSRCLINTGYYGSSDRDFQGAHVLKSKKNSKILFWQYSRYTREGVIWDTCKETKSCLERAPWGP